MDNTTIISILILAGIVLWVYTFMRSRGKDEANRTERFEQGTKASARVVHVESSRLSRNRQTVLVRLRLEITEGETPPYTLTTDWQVDAAAADKCKENRVIPVKIDAQEHSIVYPQVGWARYNWAGSGKRGKGTSA